MRLEGCSSEKRRRGIQGQQPFEDRGGLLLALEAVDRPVEDGVRYCVGKFDRGELVRQVGLVGSGQRLDELSEIVALLGGQRRRDRRAERLANAEPVAIEIIGKGAERPRAAAHQPAEDDAAADVQQAPPPALGRAELVACLRRQQSDGHFLGQKLIENAVGEGEFVLAIGRLSRRRLLQRIRRIRLPELLFEDRLVRREERLERELEVFVVQLCGIEDAVLG